MPGHAGGGHSGSIHSSGGSSSRSSGGGHSGSVKGSSFSFSELHPSYRSRVVVRSSSGRRYVMRRRGVIKNKISFFLLFIFSFLLPFLPLFGTLSDFGLYTPVPDKLLAEQCKPLTVCVEDNTGLLTRDGAAVIQKSIDYYYDKTGVQPYFLLLPELDNKIEPEYSSVDNYLYSKYVNMFPSDEGHFVLLMITDGKTYSTWYIIGDDAVTLSTNRECEKLLDDIDTGFTKTNDISAIVSDSLNKSADRIMIITAGKLKIAWNAIIGKEKSKRASDLRTSLICACIFLPFLICGGTAIVKAIFVKRKNT